VPAETAFPFLEPILMQAVSALPQIARGYEAEDFVGAAAELLLKLAEVPALMEKAVEWCIALIEGICSSGRLDSVHHQLGNLLRDMFAAIPQLDAVVEAPTRAGESFRKVLGLISAD
jgi:hypothetical protein